MKKRTRPCIRVASRATYLSVSQLVGLHGDDGVQRRNRIFGDNQVAVDEVEHQLTVGRNFLVNPAYRAKQMARGIRCNSVAQPA